MEKKKKLVPKLRFKEFLDAGDWEQRKLGEVVSVYDGVHQTPDYKESGIMFLSVEDITSLRSEKYISEEAFKKDYKVYPQKGDILMTRIGDVGTTNVVETTEKLAFYVSLALLKPNGINSYFLSNAIQSPLFQKGLKDRTLVTAIPQKINKDEIGKVDLILPKSVVEQKRIGEYFRNLDNLITLHQRKVDKLQQVKKAHLCEMFPENGKTKPKRRFKCFTDDWEQRKLGELGEIVTGSTPSTTHSEYYSDDGIPWVTPTDINENLICDTPRKLSDEGAKVSRVVPANTILCTCIASIGKNALLTVKGSFNQQINSLTPSKENDAYFLLTESELWSNTMKRMAASGTMQIVNKAEFSELQTMVPSLPEQQQIGTYFQQLDTLITLHQRKVEKLKKLKESYLNDMFV